MKTIETPIGLLEEGIHFNYFKDGNGVNVPVANLSHKIFEPRNSGSVIVESYYVSRNKLKNQDHKRETRFSENGFKDKVTGIWFGTPLSINNEKGNIIWKKVNLNMRRVLDLSIPSDREDWVVISRSRLVEGSPNQLQGKSLYKVVDHEVQSVEKKRKLDLKYKAIDIARNLTGTEIEDVALFLGLNARAYSVSALATEVLLLIESKYEDFMEFWSDANRYVRVVFQKALNLGVIHRSNEVSEFGSGAITYMFEKTRLGISETEAIMFLTNNKHTSLLNAVITKTEISENQRVGLNNKISSTPSVIETNKEVEDLKRQLAEANAKLALANTVEINPNAKTDEADVDSMNEVQLRTFVTTKHLKIKGNHLMGLEVLRENVKSALKQTEAV